MIGQCLRCAVVTVLISWACAGTASAVDLLWDDFESYTTGAIVPQTGTVAGWSGNWSSSTDLTGTTPNNLIINAPGGGYTDGQRQEILESAGQGGSAYRAFTTPLQDVADNTYYLSFDAQCLNGGLRFFGLALYNNSTERMLLGSGSGRANYTINNMDVGGVSTTVESTVPITDQAHLLMKLVFGGAGTPENVSFWVNPVLTESESSANNLAQLVGGTSYTSFIDWGDITQARMGGGFTSGGNTFAAHWVDNLLISTDSPFATLQPGDANGDGMVNLSDLQILGDNWQSTTATWAEADFTGDGTVNLADLQILGDNWGFGVGPDISFDEALAAAAIPEPAALALLVAAVPFVLRRRG
ncbi:MAG: hypothetical protein IT445_14135 [Phycisphaeraceae bacterium]|nr:hypothetical protein [Phycisphaeraceae bacterium]